MQKLLAAHKHLRMHHLPYLGHPELLTEKTTAPGRVRASLLPIILATILPIDSYLPDLHLPCSWKESIEIMFPKCTHSLNCTLFCCHWKYPQPNSRMRLHVWFENALHKTNVTAHYLALISSNEHTIKYGMIVFLPILDTAVCVFHSPSHRRACAARVIVVSLLVSLFISPLFLNNRCSPERTARFEILERR